MDDEEYVVGYSANILERTFRIFSNTGTVKQIVCDSPEQFHNVVTFMEKTLKKEDWTDEFFLGV